MRRVLVIGDVIWDVYRYFSYRKQCPDAPETPVGILSQTYVCPGGAANVALNLAALLPDDVAVDLIGIIPIPIFQSDNIWPYIDPVTLDAWNGIGSNFSFGADRERCLIKDRVYVSGMREDPNPFIARLDNRYRFDPDDVAGMLEKLTLYFQIFSPDLIVVSDYAAGTISDAVLAALAPFRDRLLVDTKRDDLSCFSSGSDRSISSIPEQRSLLVKLNQHELRNVLLRDPIPERHFKYFIVTCGSGGARMTVYRDAGTPTQHLATMGSIRQDITIPARKVEEVDVCGCGDTFLAGFAAGLLRYNDPYEALGFANAAAATVVTKPRTSVASLDRTLEMTGRLPDEACE